MRTILEPIKSVIPLLEDVTINHKAIEKFTSTVSLDNLTSSEYNHDTLLANGSEGDYIAFCFIYNSLNFSYWGNPKWTIDYNGNSYDGSAAMIRALKAGIDAGYDLLNPSFLAALTALQLHEILLGNVEIPLFSERLKCLNQLGMFIVNNYHGSFTNFMDSAEWDSETIVSKLANELPDVFNDTVTYRGKVIHFYKRAQLIPTHLNDLYQLGKVKRHVKNMAQLTAFADYKIPQLMRQAGILTYSDKLSCLIDDLQELPEGSNEETEIRIAAIWANELCTRYIHKRAPQATAIQVDGLFWFAGQASNAAMPPYHRTRTIWY
jgi:hypothetical protein